MRNAALGPMLRAPDGGSGGGPPPWRADRLVFVNDVFFCARDVLRLLQARARPSAALFQAWVVHAGPCWMEYSQILLLYRC